MMNWVIVVDDSTEYLYTAGNILGKNGLRVVALDSGSAFLDYIEKNGLPNLVLLDIIMPEMDGFETLKRLREFEEKRGLSKVPVIFLTASEDTDTESRSLELGVTDYIRKPFDPNVFAKRVINAIHAEDQLRELKKEASRDSLTGLLNKTHVNRSIANILETKGGCLIMMDLDAFKLVNDLYGHVTGDDILKEVAKLLRDSLGEDTVIGRIGGDEFLFLAPFETEEELAVFTANANEKILAAGRRLMGEDMDIDLGISIGAVMIDQPGQSIRQAVLWADKALYNVKHNNKHGYCIFHEDMTGNETEDKMSLAHISAIMEERNILNHALDLNKDTFIPIYRFVMRYIKRYGKSAANVLFTLELKDGSDRSRRSEYMEEFLLTVQNMLRKSDIITQLRNNQLLVMLTEVKKGYVDTVISKILNNWNRMHEDIFDITYESEFYDFTLPDGRPSRDVWVMAVDDDEGNLRRIGHILSRDNIRVTALDSGEALLSYLSESEFIPDLILLDVKMPKMDGFETLKRLRGQNDRIAAIPVIFLTAANDDRAETRGLALGAMDFIRKPIVPQVLLLRVRHMLDLIFLQRNLANEVEQKTQENEQLFFHVVQSLTDAIDAKDTYTNGHSERVANYTREIARRYGYDEKHLNDIYMMGLLHDVGKIGVPSAVINKPGRLTDEEFALIKQHPVMGAHILENIKEMPMLAIGARWHHERFSGGGYPDGIAGEDIPEEARIIAVADAYDAMTSKRSYRDALPQDVVRGEIEKNRGTQFDPVFADIMLEMMAEDREYNLRER